MYEIEFHNGVWFVYRNGVWVKRCKSFLEANVEMQKLKEADDEQEKR